MTSPKQFYRIIFTVVLVTSYLSACTLPMAPGTRPSAPTANGSGTSEDATVGPVETIASLPSTTSTVPTRPATSAPTIDPTNTTDMFETEPAVTAAVDAAPTGTDEAEASSTEAPVSVDADPASAASVNEAFTPRYAVQAGTPAQTGNFVEPSAACNWVGVGGQVFNVNSQSVTGVVVEVVGTYNGKAVDLLTLTGSSQVLGPGGYQITFGNKPLATDDALWLRLFDIEGNPLSRPVYFDTFEDCQRNLILINFTEITEERARLFLPSVPYEQVEVFIPNVGVP